MNFDRFKEPNANDERAACVNCEKPCHYAALDENGLCGECAELYAVSQRARENQHEP